jgi:hypothetical protein
MPRLLKPQRNHFARAMKQPRNAEPLSVPLLGVGIWGFPMFELTIAFFVTFGLAAFVAHRIEASLPR